MNNTKDFDDKIKCKRCGEWVPAREITLAWNLRKRVVELCNMCVDNFDILYTDKDGNRRYNGK